MEPEGELERTYKVRQDEIKADVAIETAKKGFELKLEGWDHIYVIIRGMERDCCWRGERDMSLLWIGGWDAGV